VIPPLYIILLTPIFVALGLVLITIIFIILIIGDIFIFILVQLLPNKRAYISSIIILLQSWHAPQLHIHREQTTSKNDMSVAEEEEEEDAYLDIDPEKLQR